MALTIEWQHRIENWRRELPRHFYRPLGTIELSGFTTLEQLSAERAHEGAFSPMPAGTPWGAKWEYGWFKGSVLLPEQAAGRRIILKIDVGGEGAVYVDGATAGAVDRAHKEITLSTCGVPGSRYEMLVEAYAWHGPTPVGVGPASPGRVTVPEPPPTQQVVGESTFGIWEEEIYQLWIDVETLWEVRENIDPESLRVAEIDAGLRDFTLIVDFELKREEMLETVRAGRERLKPLLECVNGSTAPTMVAFGHAHIDVAWLWPLAETERKCVRTFATQLALMDQYPEYRFLQSQPHLYQMVQSHYPKLYARIKAAVERGQWIADGATWVEPDTNISGGESLIRQFVYGKRFYDEEFGVACQMLWLPDVFGYSGALPQIMRGCGVRYFSTQKIFWAYNGGAPFPHNTFVWEGIDGSEVLVHLHNDYNSQASPAYVIQRWRERVQKDGFSTRLMPFGWGDGGGGPTRHHLEFLRRQHDLEGVPRVQIVSPMVYFKDQEAEGWPDVRYVGELYFQAHRGTYTSQARTKRGNRKSEFALREAELWSVAAAVLKGSQFPAEALDEAWKLVLLNQFHDILPGSSIQRVYEEAEAAYASVLSTAGEIAQHATACLTDDSQAITVFNSLSWARTALIPLPEGWAGAVDEAGDPLPVQVMGNRTWAETVIPPCGWMTLYPAAPAENPNTLTATERLLENDLLRVELNGKGEITGIWDKEAEREVAAGPCNSLRLYKDVPTNWDAWDLDSMYELTPVPLDQEASIEVMASGPLTAALRVTRQLHRSTMTQEISLRRGSRRIDFHTVLDWQESHKLLKVNFPVTVHASEALHEIQFGHIRRPTHKSRPFDADRFEVCNHKWTALVEENRGCAVLNDCKYGVNVAGSSINLTLLKSPLAPDMAADKGRQEFTYAFYTWNGSFFQSPLVQEAYDLNTALITAAGAGGTASLFSIDAPDPDKPGPACSPKAPAPTLSPKMQELAGSDPNVVIETVKLAEDGSGDVIVRLYESKRTATRCTLTTSLPIAAAAQTDMLEEEQETLSCSAGKLPLVFRAFEIKTVRLKLRR